MPAPLPPLPRPARRIHPLPPCSVPRLPRLLVVAGFATIALSGALLGGTEAWAEDAPAGAASGAVLTSTTGGASGAAGASGTTDGSETADADAVLPEAPASATGGGAEAAPVEAAADPTAAEDDADGAPDDDAADEPVIEAPAAPEPGAAADEDPGARGTSADGTAGAEAAPAPVDPVATPVGDAPESGTTEPRTADPDGDTPVAGDAAAVATAAPEPTDPAAEVLAAAEPAGTEPVAAPAMASASVEASRTALAAPAAGGFTDIPVGTMYREEILWAQRQGIVTGWPDGTFRPTLGINRDAFVTMLFRLNAPSTYVAPAVSRFRDVSVTDMYYREISWAAEKGITTGWADGTFRPVTAIDRDAALAMLYRVYGRTGVAGPTRSPFLDVTPQSEHYQAMAWGYANGITTGWPDGTFRPGADIARDATAVMLHRLVAQRPSTAQAMLNGPTGAYWTSHGGASAVGGPTGFAYRYGNGLRQDFDRGSVLHSPVSGGITFVAGTELAAYDARGGQATFGMVTTERTVRGATVYQEFDRGGIYTTDRFTFAVTGSLFSRFRAAGGVDGYLGAPIGDLRTGTSGISYQTFMGGQLTTPDYLDTPPPTTPAGGTSYTYPTLSQGSTGDKVRAVQAKVGAAVDGKYGAGTAAAVRAFQQAQGIPVTGIVDSRTWARIMSAPNTRFNGTNGRLAASQLSIVAPNWTLPHDAARDFLAMQAAFRTDTGRVFTLNDAYRPIDRQIQLFVAYGAPRAALPGTSNHGDASTGAVDISLERDDVTYTWLVGNAARFGFGQSAFQRDTEPWHWQHTY